MELICFFGECLYRYIRDVFWGFFEFFKYGFDYVYGRFFWKLFFKEIGVVGVVNILDEVRLRIVGERVVVEF